MLRIFRLEVTQRLLLKGSSKWGVFVNKGNFQSPAFDQLNICAEAMFKNFLVIISQRLQSKTKVMRAGLKLF